MVVFPPYSDYLVLDTTVGGDQLSGWYGAAEQSDVRHGLRSIKLTEPQTGSLVASNYVHQMNSRQILYRYKTETQL